MATPAKKKAKPKQKKAGNVFRGKRKESIARATVRKGKGKIRINSTLLSAVDNKFVRGIVSEPLHLAPEIASQVDISINVAGGGQMGQAQADRHTFLVSAGKELAGLLSGDFNRLKAILGRIK